MDAAVADSDPPAKRTSAIAHADETEEDANDQQLCEQEGRPQEPVPEPQVSVPPSFGKCFG